MGNQNQSQGNKEAKNNQCNEEQYSRIDFDALLHQWIWSTWLKTRSKASAHHKHEDLLISIDWKDILFAQDTVQFWNSSTIHHPQSQILFRTSFENQTMSEHFYTLRTERTTYSSFKYQLSQALSKSQGSSINFSLPTSIMQHAAASGISRDQPISSEQDTAKEQEVRWPIDSQIRVAGRTRTLVELVVDEEEFQSQFSIPIRFSGRLSATIATRQSPHIVFKVISGDLVTIVRDTMKTHGQSFGLEIHGDRSPYVCFTLRGKCSFRYGIKQNILLQQESLESSSSMSCSDLRYSPSAPTDYCHLTSLNINQSTWEQKNGKSQSQL